jgi:hypothetical protein
MFEHPDVFWERVLRLYGHLGWRHPAFHHVQQVAVEVDAVVVVCGDATKLPPHTSMGTQQAFHMWLFGGVEMTNTVVLMTSESVTIVTSDKKKKYLESVSSRLAAIKAKPSPSSMVKREGGASGAAGVGAGAGGGGRGGVWAGGASSTGAADAALYPTLSFLRRNDPGVRCRSFIGSTQFVLEVW